MSTIGEITLNLSLLIYICYFLPQLWHNYRGHHTDHISLMTQALMVFANSLDLIFGIGNHLQWQYILVSILTLTALFIQQCQILTYTHKQKKALTKVKLHSLVVLIWLVFLGAIALFELIPKDVALTAGWISSFIYIGYWIPQVYYNFVHKVADGFSVIYLVLALIANGCDLISALAFGWPLSRVWLALVLISFMVIMLIQNWRYQHPKITGS